MVCYNVNCIQTLFFFLVTVYKTSCSATTDKRFPAKAFTPLTLGDKVVFCQKNNETKDIYVSLAYECHNMTIDGLRLRYINVKKYHTGKPKENPGKQSPTATENYDIRNDLVALCKEMLRDHGVTKSLWTVYVKDVFEEETKSQRIPPKPTETPSKDKQQRVIFVNTKNGFSWELTPPGKGYIKSIVCMVDDR